MSRPATSRLKCNAVLGAPPSLEWISVNQLLIDEAYQRTVDTGPSQTLIRRIAQFWDWGLCQPLAVSRRPDGKLLIVDGQHRASGAKLRGDIQHLPCVITSYANAGDEAAAFVALNQQRRPLSALDLFKAAVAAEDKEALEVARAMSDAGLRLAKHMNYISWKPGDVSNIGGILRLWRRNGDRPVSLAMKAMGLAWPGEVLRYCGSVFPGFAAVALDEVRLRADPDRLVEELAALAGSRSQADWRKAAQVAAPEIGGSPREGAEHVFRQAWRSRHSASALAASIDPQETAWCQQCDQRVSGQKAARCASPFCSLKQKAA